MKAADIETRRKELVAELAELDRLEAAAASHRQRPSTQQASVEETPKSPRERFGSTRSLRDAVLDALEEIGFMTYGQQLAMYIKARFGREIQPTRLGTLSADEEKALRRGSSRPVWLCHGLTHDRTEAVKRLWARSDWDLADRVVTPVFGRAQYLRSTARFSALAMKADGFAANPELLRFIAADHARDLGLTVQRGRFELEEWRAMAERQLSEISTKEREFVNRSLAIWPTTLSTVEKLFGRAPRPFVVGQAEIEKQA